MCLTVSHLQGGGGDHHCTAKPSAAVYLVQPAFEFREDLSTPIEWVTSVEIHLTSLAIFPGGDCPLTFPPNAKQLWDVASQGREPRRRKGCS